MIEIDDQLEVLLISVDGVKDGIENRQFANRIGEDVKRDEETRRIIALLELAMDKCDTLLKFLREAQS